MALLSGYWGLSGRFSYQSGLLLGDFPGRTTILLPEPEDVEQEIPNAARPERRVFGLLLHLILPIRVQRLFQLTPLKRQ